MKVGFHSNQLSLRGTEIALYDYADFNERLLGNQSVIFTPFQSEFHSIQAAEKFSKRFKICSYTCPDELNHSLAKHEIDFLYCIKAGFDDGLKVTACPTGVHAVFPYFEPHGAVYAYVSQWLSESMGNGQQPFVPHLVTLPRHSKNLRKQLDIPPEAVVFGRYGGFETFDILFVQHVVDLIAAECPQLYFLFLNTQQFGTPRKNLIFLESTSDLDEKVTFINSCDAMLHARTSGETFGLAIAEFAFCEKPIISWSGSHEKGHYQILKDQALYYSDANELAKLLVTFSPNQGPLCTRYAEEFSPEIVMRKFYDVFLSR